MTHSFDGVVGMSDDEISEGVIGAYDYAKIIKTEKYQVVSCDGSFAWATIYRTAYV